MKFDNDYWHALDKQTASRLDVNPRYIGRSANPTADQVEGLKTRIFQGATHVELGFFGEGKGSKAQGRATPEVYGREQREAIRQMAKLNEITLSVHASPNTGPLSGMTEHGFSEEAQEKAVTEIRRAIDFAAETSGGGPVVVHLQGEFPKPITERKGFEAYPEEKKKAPVYLVNDLTGEMKGFRKDTGVSVFDHRDEKTGEMVFKEKKFEEFEDDFNKLSKKEKEEEYSNNAGKYFYSQVMKKDVLSMKGESDRHYNMAEKIKEEKEDLQKMKKTFDRVVETSADKESAKYMYIQALANNGILSKKIAEEIDKHPEVLENPGKFIEEKIKDAEREERYCREIAEGQGMRADSVIRDIEHLKPIEEVGIQKSAYGVARAAMHAYEKEKAMSLEKPLFVAPENIFPEMGYGAHPEELKEIVLKSREAMKDMLIKQNHLPEDRAEKIAKEHIKATFDIGHAYTWRKYFDGTDEEFNKWLKDQVGELQKKEIIGHVHLSDNFGYYDEELAVGEGKAPVKEFVQQMRESGYKGKMVVESPEDLALYPAWRTLSSPVYRVNGQATTWTEIQGSYFGRTQKPNYTFGEGVQINDDWAMWSGQALE